jgi:hypothetical protein
MATIPSFAFGGFYYFDILRNLIQYQRQNVPEITDESEEEPFTQALRAWALAHHYTHTLLDVVANETLLPTARLLESVRSQLKLIDYKLKQASPSIAEVVIEFSAVFTSTTLIVPLASQFGTLASQTAQAIIFEAVQDYTISRTDQLTYVYGNPSAALTLANKSGNLFDFSSPITVAEGDIIYQAGNYAIITEIVDSDTLRVNDPTLIVNGAAYLMGSNFGSNKSGEAVTPALTFVLHGAEPKAGDIFYLGHDSVMWDQVDLSFTHGFKTGINGVWEFYDGSADDANPDDVTNLGPNLEFDLTSLLGTSDKTGTVVRVTYVNTSASEEVVSIYVGGVNIARSTGLLGQVTPSTTETDYLVGSVWAPLEVSDGTYLDGAFTQDGSITYSLPQEISKNWQKATINAREAFWIRFRVQSLTKAAAVFVGSGFNALGLDSSNCKVKIKIDAYASTEIDVTGNLGATPGAYSLTSVITAINTALAGVNIALATVASAFSGQIKLTAPNAALGKDSLIRFDVPSANDAGNEIFGITETGYPKDTIGIGGTPIFEDAKIDEGKQYLLIVVSQGTSVSEEPIASSNGEASQSYVLAFRPLIEGSLVVEVDEGGGFTQYDLVENLLNSDANTKAYTLDITADDVATIEFGDGINGKIPPAGIDNIRVAYRIGADVNGNVGSRTIVDNTAGIGFVNRVFNPRPANSWVEKVGLSEESLARAKIEGPASIRTLGKAITPADIETLAKSFVSPTTSSTPVSRALAIEETFGVKTVELIVVGTGGVLLTASQRTELDEYFNGSKPKDIDGVLVTNHEVTTVNYTPRLIDVTAVVTGGNAESIKNALTALLSPDATYSDNVTYRWNFGSEVPRSLIISTIHETDQTNVKKVVLTSPLTDIALNSRELPLAGTISITVI